MKKPKAPKHADMNQLAYAIVQAATDENPATEELSDKNPHAVALGRLGGLKGGKARAEALTPERRKEIAKKAIEARWKKEKAAK
jgi:methenyltetrahydromethanopterin cyclohydrolase